VRLAAPVAPPRVGDRRPASGARVSVRLGAVAILALYGGVRWMEMLEPAPTGRAWAAVGLAIVVGPAALATRALRPRARAAALAALVLACLVAGALLSGIPIGLFAPKKWDNLVSGVADGLGALPEVEVPYNGAAGGWTARVIELGGVLLPMLAAVAACRPRARDAPPWLAAILLGTLAGVPAVVLPDAGVAQGALLFAGLVALLALDRVRRPNLPAAGVALAVALGLALVLFPAADGTRPWFDYEAAAQNLVPRATTFDWTHSYAKMTWPRTGRLLLRVHAARPSYWKTEDLDTFDGLVWRGTDPGEIHSGIADSELSVRAAARPEDVHRITVTLSGLRTPFVVAAGDTLRVERSPRDVREGASTGTFVADPELRQGDAYQARVYVPEPTQLDLRDAGTNYPGFLFRDREVKLPPAAAALDGAPGRAARAAVARDDIPTVVPTLWGSRASAVSFGGTGNVSARTAIAGSAYARVWRIADRLSARARTPYDYALSIEAYLSQGFRYSETPRQAHVPLADFLLRGRVGYCQHFSGAMALLLRMGGVPARVASGFSPGTQDGDTGDWEVRDVDAHSWVEVFFPNYGWVTFDPTPAASPARGQETLNRVPEAAGPGAVPAFGQLNKDLNDPRTAKTNVKGLGGLTGPEDRGGVAWWAVAVGVAGLLALAGFAAWWWRRRRPRGPDDETLAELERALRRSGRGLPAGTTLRELEERFRGSSDAQGYVRAVRAVRYGAGGPGPTPAERRGLRRELARGLGATGALRGWWAVPPAPPRRRSHRP
jgi:transglutaminase-like putative cysteine protease